MWNVYRRYTEFCRLHSLLKKQVRLGKRCEYGRRSDGFLFSPLLQVSGFSLKLPGKRLFGSNFDPSFLKSRCEGLSDYIICLTNDERLLTV